jgi:glutathione reductase (NADPH)
MADFDFDLITIGAGSGGVRAARMSANHGARVAIMESGPLGGTCVNVGCIPKKLLSYAAHYREDFEDASGYGWEVAPRRFDWPSLIAAKDTEIRRLNGIYERMLRDAGVEIFAGRARLVGPHEVALGGQTHSARHILIASGGHPVRAALPGGEQMITSEDAFHLKQLPACAVVYGAGYIAVEFASIFNGLGVETHLVYRADRLLRGFDGDIGPLLAEEMSRKGVNLHPSCRIERIVPGDIKRVTLSDGTVLAAGCVLGATGRAPNSANLGLEELGVAMGEHGAIQVDGTYTTNLPSIHAIGDVTDRIQLTPVALAEGMAFADHWFGKGLRKVSYENVPTAVFSHPNVACVGLSEEAARLRGAVRIYKSSFGALRHTLSGRGERTFMKLVVDAQNDRVLGAHMIGPDAGEVLQGFAVALNCGATKAQFDATIGIHPTVAEEFLTMRAPAS